MFRVKFTSFTAAFAVLCLMAAATPGTAQGAMTAQQASDSIERQFGVKVLKISKTTFAGKSVFLLTVMSPGGNENSAFQVSRLAVDPDTGRLVSGFRHRRSGYDYAEGDGANETNRQPTGVLRQGWNWR
jgi:hypothetical protein